MTEDDQINVSSTREMAVDVPESFVAQTKTPPKYPPPSSTTSSNRNSLINGNHYHGSPPPPMLRDGQCDLADLTLALMNWMNQLLMVIAFYLRLQSLFSSNHLVKINSG